MYKDINKMSAENLSMIFGHNFMRSEPSPNPEQVLRTSAQVQRYIAILVDNSEWFFSDDKCPQMTVPPSPTVSSMIAALDKIGQDIDKSMLANRHPSSGKYAQNRQLFSSI